MISINPSTTIDMYLLKQYIPIFQRTNMMKRIEILLVLSLINPTLETNNTLPNQSEHYLVKWNAWQSLSVLGFVGTLSNTLLIYTFYSQPNMATSVNAMIFMETVYRLVYATTCMHWRTYNMVMESTLFSYWLTKEEVKKSLSLLMTSRLKMEPC